MKHFCGGHFEVGEQIGSYYAKHGMQFARSTAIDLLKQQVSFYEQAAPEILDELRGIAAGGNFQFEDVAHFYILSSILYYKELKARSCSIGGFVDQKNQSWIARNYDWYPLVAEHFQAWRFDFPNISVAAISDMCISEPGDANKSEQRFCYDDAINSHGLYVGLTYAHCAPVGIGITTPDMVKLVSWRCKTVAEALDLFANTKLSCAKNYFIADRTGKMAVVEHAVMDFEVRYPDSDGILVLTNHYGKALKDRDLVESTSTTWERYSKLHKDLDVLKRSGVEITFNELDKIMTNPKTPVCQFLPDDEIETVWTLLMQPTQEQYQLIGNPRSSARSTIDFSMSPLSITQHT